MAKTFVVPKIANEMNQYFTKKIKKMRKNLNRDTSKAMKVLEKLIEKPKSKFKLKPVNVNKVYEVIQKSKASNSTGHDNLSMNIIKEIPQFMARVLCNLFNTIIRTKVYPDNLKISKVIPIRKPDKPMNLKDFHRPINILPTVDKVIEALICEQMESYFQNNHLIPNSHNGGRKHHSTVSAMMAMDHKNKMIKSKKATACILSTDLSSAFDLVDHGLLLDKLRYFSVGPSSIEILRSFLSNRSCFTEIQGFRSTTIMTEACSVVQGSKLSGFLHTVFSIEIPLIPILMRNRQLAATLLEITIPTFYSVEHSVNQYIDDSTNLIGTDTMDELIRYNESYLKVLEAYYSLNRLKINSGKTKILITKHPAKRQNNEPISFMSPDGETIIESNSIKILGFIRNNRDSMDSHINMVSGRVNSVLTELSPLLGHMSLKVQKEVVYSKAASFLLYGAEMYTNINQ